MLPQTTPNLSATDREVSNKLQRLGLGQLSLEIESVMVTPQQLLGIEVNPRAAAIAELVLWIGYLQWHLRTRGDMAPAEPIIRDFHNIERRDAVLDWDATEPLRDAGGRPVTRWDGRTTKPHPVTGEDVPDETARVPVYRYLNPRPAAWPAAEFVVGNPPFIGTARMRDALGDGYAEAIRATYPAVPASADYVMYWWHRAAGLARVGAIRRFGFIATNSLRQTFNRRVLQTHMEATPPLSLLFAIPDHPWVDSADGAAVRISMTVGTAGEASGKLKTVTVEQPTESGEVEVDLVEQTGKIQPDLTIGPDVAQALILKGNERIGNRGVQLIGTGFIVTEGEANQLGVGRIEGLEKYIRPYRNGKDITQISRNVLVIDLFGLEIREVQERFPEVYQWILERVKPERDQNNRKAYRDKWWVFGEPVKTTRDGIADLERYIVTCRTAKHRTFTFLDSKTVPDAKLVTIALEDAYFLGILSSKIHVTWAIAAGAWLGVGNDSNYNHSDCFGKFPFPDPTDAQRGRIRELGEQLDAHRKSRQAQHPRLTLTDMYNVLAKLRAGEPLTDADRRIHEQGLVSVLRQLHDELDAAVLEAYGWEDLLDLRGLPRPLRSGSNDIILERLVALNAERAAEEARGHVRWLRPEYQASDAVAPATQRLLLEEEATPAAQASPAIATPWPDSLAARAAAVRAALVAFGRPVTAEEVAASFAGRATDTRREQVGELLQTLAALGQARAGDGGLWSAE